MGSKFCNLSIFGADAASVEAACPGLIVRQATVRCVTAAGEALDFGRTEKEAKRLSIKLSCLVLATEYFDDDYVSFSVYRNGKKEARHIPTDYEGFSRSPGKSRVWAELFGLDADGEKRLRLIFRETNPETSLHLMECILGCPLWVDAEWMDSIEPPQDSYLTGYLERKEAEKKLKNQTKLVLLDELHGDMGWWLTLPLVRDEKHDRVKSFWDIRDGKFCRLFETEIPQKPDGGLVRCRGENAFLLSFWDMGEPDQPAQIVHAFSDTGELLDSFIPESGFPHNMTGLFLNRDFAVFGDQYRDLRAKETGTLTEVQTAYSAIPCALGNGSVAIVYDTRPEAKRPMDSFLRVISGDGSVQAEIRLSSFRHWQQPIAYRGNLLLACETKLCCYSPSLALLWSAELSGDVGQLNRVYLDEASNLLYFSNFRCVTAFDLENRRIHAERVLADGEDVYLHEVLPGVGPIMLTGDSSIQVWDPELRLISRHRTKGIISMFLHMEGETCLLTLTKEEHELVQTENGFRPVVKKEGCAYLYALR